jgi:hypothetical protein
MRQDLGQAGNGGKAEYEQFPASGLLFLPTSSVLAEQAVPSAAKAMQVMKRCMIYCLSNLKVET